MLNEYMGKNDTLRGLASNKEISLLMRNAIDSPIGSTHRKRAGSVLSVLKKANLAGTMGIESTYFDGAGGPGETATTTPENYNDFAVFPAAPPMNGPGNVDWKAEMNNGAALQYGNSNQRPDPTNTSLPPVSKVQPEANYGLYRDDNGMLRSDPNSSVGFGGMLGEMGKTIYGDVKKGVSDTWSNLARPSVRNQYGILTTDKSPLPDNSYAQPTPGDIPSGYDASAATGTTLEVKGAATTGTKEGGTQTGGTQTGGTTSSTKGGTQGGSTPGMGSNILSRSLARGIGPAAFAIRAQLDPQGYKQMMKDVAGIDIPDENLPTGKLLSSQLNDIEIAIKGKYNIDGLLNEKNSMLATGITITRDLQAYIRGRDQYLTQTQRMIDDFDNNLGNRDLSDPHALKQAENYVNYLYTLRGQQNQNYVGFVNSAITQYSRELTEVSNNYDKALTGMQHEYTTKAAVTTEQYTRDFAMLQEMYNNAEAAPLKKLQYEAAYAQLHPALMNTIGDGLGNIKSNAYSKDAKDFNDSPVFHKGDANDPKNGALSDEVDSVVNTIGRYAPNGGQSIIAIVDGMTRGMNARLKGITDPAELDKMTKKYLDMIDQWQKEGANDQYTVEMARQMAKSVTDRVTPALKKSFEAPAATQSLKKAVNSISKNSLNPFKNWGSRTLSSRSQFMADNPDLSPEIAGLLYTWVDTYMAGENITDARNIQSDIKDQSGAPKRIGDLTDTELTDFMSRTIGHQMFTAYGTLIPQQ